MHMQIVWGRILPGRWDAFEAAYKEAIARRGEVRGLKDTPFRVLPGLGETSQVFQIRRNFACCCASSTTRRPGQHHATAACSRTNLA